MLIKGDFTYATFNYKKPPPLYKQAELDRRIQYIDSITETLSMTLAIAKTIDDVFESNRDFREYYSDEVYNSYIKEKQKTMYSDLFLDIAYPVYGLGQDKIKRLYEGNLTRGEKELAAYAGIGINKGKRELKKYLKEKGGALYDLAESVVDYFMAENTETPNIVEPLIYVGGAAAVGSLGKRATKEVRKHFDTLPTEQK